MSKLTANLMIRIFISLTLIFTSLFAQAQAFGPQLTYHGRILDTNGGLNVPVTGSVTFLLQVVHPDVPTCVLYQETQVQNLTAADGNFTLTVNGGASTLPAALAAPFADIFITDSSRTMNCINGGTAAGTTNSRRLNVYFIPPGGTVYEPLPSQAINYVPLAIEALNTNAVGGFGATSLLRVVEINGFGVPVPYAVPAITRPLYEELDATIKGQSSYYITSQGTVANFSGALVGDVTGVQSATVLSRVFGRPLTTTSSTFVGGEVLYFDGTNWIAKQASGGTVQSVDSANNYLTVAGAPPSNNPTIHTLLTINVGTVANTVAAGDDPRIVGALQASTPLTGDVTGLVSSTVVATVGGKSAAAISTTVDDVSSATSNLVNDAIVKRNGSGNVTVNTISSTNNSTRNILLFNAANTFNATINVPTALAVSYTLTLPNTAPVNGFVLATDGTGQTSWISPTTGNVTNVSATAPLVSTGGQTPTISIPAASSIVDGFLSAVSFLNFSNKVASVTVTAPLTIGGTSMTPQIGLQDSGVSAGTYTKVVVDAKGIITSGTTLIASDIPDLDASKITTGTLPIARGGTGVGALAGDGFITTNTAGTSLTSTVCAVSEMPYFNGTNWVCITASSANSSSTVVLRDNNGNFTANNITTVQDMTVQRNLRVQDGTVGGYIGLTTPVGIANYDIVLPGNGLPSIGQVLSVASGTTSATIITTWVNALSDALASGSMFVGNASGTATGVMLSGDATMDNTGNLQLISVGAGVTSGTEYTKVTVDGKGRVTSGGQLNNADVTAGLGYTPMNSVSSTSPVTISGGASNPVIGFENSGVASGTYGSSTSVPVFTIDIFGRITSATMSAYADATNVTKGIVQIGNNITVAGGVISLTNQNVVSALGYTPFDQATGLQGDVTGTLSATVVAAVGGKTSAQVSQSVSDTIEATHLNSSGTIVRRDNDGNFTANNITTVQDMTVQRNLRVQDGSMGGYIGLTTPVGIANYDIVLPGNSAPSVGQVLSAASGTTSATVLTTWINALTDSLASGSIFVGNASGTATAAVMSGDATMDNTGNLQLISVGAGVASGTEYTKVTVDGKGRVTSGAQLNNADVVAGLGYVPMNTVSSTAPITLTGGASNPVIGLADSGVVSGTYGSNTLIPFFTVDNFGRIASAGSFVYADATSGTKGIVQIGDNITVTTGVISVTSANIVAAMGTLGGDVSGTLNNTVVMTVGGKTSAQISQSVSDTIEATHLNSSGTIVRRDNDGNFTANNITTVQDMTVQRNLRVQDGSVGGYIGLTTPIGITNYDIVLPGNGAPSVGQVLAAASGTTSATVFTTWINALTDALASGSILVGNASGTATPAVMTGDATIDNTGNLQLISVGAGVTSGTEYTKVTVDGKGRVTSGAQLNNADVVAALGYTPADDAVSGTYLRRANDLSDLASSATARTNLGLGTFATASFLDLGGASATGIIADARLQDFTNVTSGTQYTKLTVDGKGRVTSGAFLDNGDVTAALGYTPMNTVSSTSPITLSGGASNPVIGLANSGVASGEYPKVTVDVWGRVTSGSVLNFADVTTGLGYTPVAMVSATAPILLTGTASNPTIALDNSGVVAGSYGSNTLIPNFIVDVWGRITSATAVAFADATSGTKGIVQIGDNITVSGGVISVTTANIVSAMGSLGGDVSGTLNATVVQTVGGKTSAQISQSVSDTIEATHLNSSGTIVRRDNNGNFSANNITTVQDMTVQRNLRVQDGSFGSSISIATPIALGSSYTIILPDNSVVPTTGQVLAVASGSTGTNVLTRWMNALTDALAPGNIFVGNASGTATPAVMTGDATIDNTGNLQLISVGAGVTSGTEYTKVTVDGKGRVTSGAQLNNADVVAALGYTPADDAVSGTYLRRANDLSDLASSATARTNLGLGTFATASFLDLGGASATGIIADARLQDFTNVTSGTQYTKLTVDGKGRVTSGAFLDNGDVTAALGYTPMNTVSSTSPITLSGGASNPVIGLAMTGVASATYPKVTVDLWGRVTSGSNLNFTDVTTGLGYTPVEIVSATSPIFLTGSASAPVINLSFSGVTSGVYPKVTVDDWGRVTSGSALNFADVTTGLGYTPTNTVSATSPLSITGGASNPVISLNTTGVTSGVYPKVTVDDWGRVTSGSVLNFADVTTGLGYTPVQIVSATAPIVLTGSASSPVINLANSGVTAGSYGTNTAIPFFTVDTWGRVTSAGTQAYADATSGTKGIVQVGSNITISAGTISVTSANVIAAMGSLDGDVSGTLNATVVQTVGGKTAAEIATTVNDVASATANNSSGTIVRRDNNGDFTANNITTVQNLTVQANLRIKDGNFGNYIALATPIGLGASYTMILPDNSVAPVAGQILAVASGSTSTNVMTRWMNTLSDALASGFIYVGNASGTATGVAMSGDATMSNVGNFQLNSVGAGVTSGAQYTKVTVDGKGRVTSGAQLAALDVTTALGYTPADDAASGTFLRRANDLSDLASSATARTNLGLGTFATASFLDLGGASATGIIADARLPDFANVTSGSIYSKVTVDGKGRVTSGAVLSNADINAALGYVPMASVSSTSPISLSGGASNPVISLDFSGVAAATYPKVTVDLWGRVTSGSNLNFADVTTGLGYTPVQIVSATAPLFLTGPASSPVINLANSGVTAGSYGSSTMIPNFTVDAFGRISVASATAYADATAGAKGIVQIGNNITVTTGTISITSANIIAAMGSLSGDVSGTLDNTVVQTVGGRTAADIATTVDAVASATHLNSSGTIVRRDANGDFTARNITTVEDMTVWGNLRVQNGLTGGSIGLTTPVGLAPAQNYNIILPNNGAPTTGQVLGVASGSTSAVIITTWVNALTDYLGDGQIYMGNASNTATGVTVAGDATISNAGVLTLASVGAGVTSGTQYTKVTVDGKGRVTSGGQLVSSDVITALGYAPSGVVSTTAPLTQSGGASTTVIGLANSGVTAGTYNKVTVDVFGRVTSSSALTAADVTTALTYTPVNRAGDTMTGGLTATAISATTIVASGTLAVGTASVTAGSIVDISSTTSGFLIPRMTTVQRDAIVSGAAQDGLQIFNTTARAFEYYDGAALTWRQVVTNNSALTSLNGSTSSTQIFATGAAGTSFGVVTANGVHTFNIPMAATTGVIQGALSNTQYQLFVDKVTAVSGVAGQIVITGTVSAPVIGLANSGITAGTYGSSSTIAVYAFDAFGRATGVTSSAMRLGSTTETGVLQVGSNITVAAGTISLTSANVLNAFGAGLSGDVTGSLSATVVATVGGRTAAQVTTTVDAVASATDQNSSGTIVRRDANGNFIANNITTVQDMTVQRNLRIQNGLTNSIGIFTPIGTPNYDIVLPDNNVVPPAGYGLGIASATASIVQTTWVPLMSTSMASGSFYVGNASGVATAVLMSGDATMTSSGVVSLVSVGADVTSGTQYTKVRVDGKGRVTSGSQLASTDVITALGYTPAGAVSTTAPITLSGPASAPVIGLANSGVAAGTYGTSFTIPIVTVDMFGRLTSVTSQTLRVADNVQTGVVSIGSNITVNGAGQISLINSNITSALGFTPVNKAGDTMTGGLTTPALSVTNLMSLGVASPTAGSMFEMSSTALGLLIPRMTTTQRNAIVSGAAQDGLQIYNTDSKSLEYYDGGINIWKTLVSNYSALTSLNGSVSSTQTFATAITGTSFGITTANGVHTFNVSLAASAGTIAGLVSNADYLAFGNKVTSVAGVAGQIVITGPTSSPAVGLVSTTVTAATYGSSFTIPTVTVDAFGRLTSVTSQTLRVADAVQTGVVSIGNNITVNGAGQISLTAANVVSALTYTPVNKAGDTMSGTLNLQPNGLRTTDTQFVLNNGGVGIGIASNNASAILDINSTTKGLLIPRMTLTDRGSITGVNGLTIYNTTSNEFQYYDGTAALWKTLGTTSSTITSLNGSTQTSQTFASGTAGTTFNISTNGSGVHTFNVPSAATAAVTQGTITNTQYQSFVDKVTSVTGTAGQISVTGATSSPTIALIATGVSAATYTKVAVDIYGRITSGTGLTASDIPTLAGDVTGNIAANTVATVGGKTSVQISQSVSDTINATSLNTVNTLVKRDATGAVSAGVISQSQSVLRGSTSGNLILAAAPITTSYALTFPAAQGALGQVLSNNGSGTLSWVDALTTTLASGTIWIGDGSNVASPRSMSGDATISNTGVVTLASTITAATVGTSSAIPVITFDAKGRLTTVATTAYQDATTSAKGVLSVPEAGNLTVTAGAISLTSAGVTSAFGTQAARTFYAGPTGGAAANPSFRTIASSDVNTFAFVTGGNSFTANATLGTADNFNLALNTNNTTRLTIASSGAVGIDITPTTEKLEVSGTVRVNGQMWSQRIASTGGAGTINWDANLSNSYYYDQTSGGGAAMTVNITNVKPGGNYIFSIKNGPSSNATGPVTINCVGAAGTLSMPAVNSRTLSRSVYTIVYDGSFCMITWVNF